jgi:hypothetical protein
MNILEFAQKFPNEASCITYFKQQRDLQGVVCKRCGSKEHYWLKGKLCYECKLCHSRQSLRSGTVMQNSKLPFRYWFIAMHLLTCTRKSFSTTELCRQLGHKRYQPIWEMVNKIHDIMGKRDEQYHLKGVIELDDGFITIEVPDELKAEPRKRGRGSQNKAKVLVMAESSPVECPRKGQKAKSVNHIKMQVIKNLESQTIAGVVKGQIDKKADLSTDDSTSYVRLAEYVNSHQVYKSSKETTEKVLPWVHVAIANAKRLLLDVHHKLKNEYLQYYLNEFCYKFNRRYFEDKIFDRLIIAAVANTSDFNSKIYNRTLCG